MKKATFIYLQPRNDTRLVLCAYNVRAVKTWLDYVQIIVLESITPNLNTSTDPSFCRIWSLVLSPEFKQETISVLKRSRLNLIIQLHFHLIWENWKHKNLLLRFRWKCGALVQTNDQKIREINLLQKYKYVHDANSKNTFDTSHWRQFHRHLHQ